ncbi:MAG: alpha/beta hydrolase [Bacteroidetes bacterium]|nr:alpha/beta hydrolase [Bacteroidota bacterium]
MTYPLPNSSIAERSCISGTISLQQRPIHFDNYENPDSTTSPILLLGGVLQNKDSWDAYIQDIKDHTPIITIDLPGIGQAGVLEATVGFDFLADCIFELLEYLHIPKVNIFSTSYSSVIAYEFSKRYTEHVDHLVISSSMAALQDKQRTIMKACITALEQNNLDLFHEIFVAGVCTQDNEIANYDLSRKVIKKLISLLSPQDIRQFIANTHRILQYTPPESTKEKIALEPLIFTGTQDQFTPPQQCQDIGKFYTHSFFGTITMHDHLFHIGNRRFIIQNILPFFIHGSLPEFVTVH